MLITNHTALFEKEDTFVLTGRGYLPIDKVKPTIDTLFYYEGQFQAVAQTVEYNSLKEHAMDMVEIETVNGNKIRCTDNVRFSVKPKYTVNRYLDWRKNEPKLVSGDELVNMMAESETQKELLNNRELEDVDGVIDEIFIEQPVNNIETESFMSPLDYVDDEFWKKYIFGKGYGDDMLAKYGYMYFPSKRIAEGISTFEGNITFSDNRFRLSFDSLWKAYDFACALTKVREKAVYIEKTDDGANVYWAAMRGLYPETYFQDGSIWAKVNTVRRYTVEETTLYGVGTDNVPQMTVNGFLVNLA